jgi:hypothetical protein
VTEAGRPVVADVRFRYPKDERRYETAGDEILAFPSLRQASFRTVGGVGTLKVWAHRITPGANSEGFEGLLRVRQGHETRHFDLKLSGGQVIVPVAGGDFEVDITFAGTDGAGSSDLLP